MVTLFWVPNVVGCLFRWFASEFHFEFVVQVLTWFWSCFGLFVCWGGRVLVIWVGIVCFRGFLWFL